MPYNRQIPDAPIAGSMLPRATELTLDDILVLIQPGNQIGQRNKSLVLSLLANWLADGNMGPIKTGEIQVGTSSWKNVECVGPSITNLYYLAAGSVANFWTSSEYGTSIPSIACRRGFNSNSSMTSGNVSKNYGYSVRLVKDVT